MIVKEQSIKRASLRELMCVCTHPNQGMFLIPNCLDGGRILHSGRRWNRIRKMDA